MFASALVDLGPEVSVNAAGQINPHAKDYSPIGIERPQYRQLHAAKVGWHRRDVAKIASNDYFFEEILRRRSQLLAKWILCQILQLHVNAHEQKLSPRSAPRLPRKSNLRH
jgi:hypothetical protein